MVPRVPRVSQGTAVRDLQDPQVLQVSRGMAVQDLRDPQVRLDYRVRLVL